MKKQAYQCLSYVFSHKYICRGGEHITNDPTRKLWILPSYLNIWNDNGDVLYQIAKAYYQQRDLQKFGTLDDFTEAVREAWELQDEEYPVFDPEDCTEDPDNFGYIHSEKFPGANEKARKMYKRYFDSKWKLNKETRKALVAHWMDTKSVSKFNAVFDLIEDAIMNRTPDDPQRIALNNAMRDINSKPRFTRHTLSFPGLLQTWTRPDEDGTYWRIGYLIEGTDPDVALTELNNAGVEVIGFNSRGAGDSYCHPAYASVAAPNRILVTQRGGLDV